MNLIDPKLTALRFNQCINDQDIDGISRLMSENHIFIDRLGVEYGDMVNGWIEFFNNFPTYKNIFNRVESQNNLVILIGYAIWSNKSLEKDHAIWKATIENDLVSKWQIYEDTEEKRRELKIL
jgi:hypothetical protein